MQKDQIISYLNEIKSDLITSGIENIGLFGSFAKNSATAVSDIDIAIKLDKNYLQQHDVWEYFTLLGKIKKMLSTKFSRKVDIYDLDSSDEINEQITKDVIYV